MAVSEVLQICPTIENLCDSTKGRPKSSFKNDVKKVYHCPIETCKYFKQENYFEKIKFLKQHFVKVHKIKSFSCEKCGKHFPLESTLNRHKLMCGVSYRCYCNAEYNAYEALITHVKRKHHVNTLKYKDMMECLKVHLTAQNVQKSFDNVFKLKAIIVENPDQQKKLLVLKEKKTKIASSKETQTGMKMCRILPNVSSPTRDVKEQNTMKTVSMQTVIEPGNRKRKKIKNQGNISKTNCFTKDISFNSSSTQTTPIKENHFIMQYHNSTKLLEISKYDVNQRLVTDSAVSKREAYKNFGEQREEFCPIHIPVQPISFEYNSDNSNSASQFVEKRMVSTDDPNLSSISVCNILSKDKNYMIKMSTDVNVVDTCMNDHSKSERNFVVNPELERREVSKIDFNAADFFINDSSKQESNLKTCSNSETQTTSPDDLHILDCLEDDPLEIRSSLIMCSDSETQTMFEDYFDNSYMDTYTQTCDSFFPDLDFVDIETQTSWSVFDESKIT